ncbi:PhnE/PtxC family ABC transporter permease, partial [Zhongshania sp.]
QFLALLLYRWEVIMRETAILGILGIGTLGFYIDSAFEEFRFDRAMLLIGCAAFLNMGVDGLAHWLRKRLHLNTTPETL